MKPVKKVSKTLGNTDFGGEDAEERQTVTGRGPETLALPYVQPNRIMGSTSDYRLEIAAAVTMLDIISEKVRTGRLRDCSDFLWRRARVMTDFSDHRCMLFRACRHQAGDATDRD